MSPAQETTIIALDVMGGDDAPATPLDGAERFLAKHPHVHFLLFGNESRIKDHIETCKRLQSSCTIHHTSEVISTNEKPSIALRKGRHSSMRLAIDAVRDNKAQAVVSAGNTGALMAMAKLSLRPLAGIDRPAITSLIPNLKSASVFLDLGANIDCNSDNLVQFAIMGNAFAKVMLQLESPSVGLLNVGAEENKGSGIVKAAAEEIREGDYGLNFYGYIEGDDIVSGTVDVVVTDGFTGNVALKTAEGTAKMCSTQIKQAFKSSPFAFLGGLLAKFALKRVFKKIDPRLHNGAMFLGLNGIAVKSHGGTDAIGFANAISVAYEAAINDINTRISDELSIDSSENSYEILDDVIPQGDDSKFA